MARTVEGKRLRDGYVERTVVLGAGLDRRLAHHARRKRIPLEEILRVGALKACRALDAEEAASSDGADVTSAA